MFPRKTRQSAHESTSDQRCVSTSKGLDSYYRKPSNRIVSLPLTPPLPQETRSTSLQRPASACMDAGISAAVDSFNNTPTTEIHQIPLLPLVTRRGRRIVSLPPARHSQPETLLFKHKSLPNPPSYSRQSLPSPHPLSPSPQRPLTRTEVRHHHFPSPSPLTQRRLVSAPIPQHSRHDSGSYGFGFVKTPSISSAEEEASSDSEYPCSDADLDPLFSLTRDLQCSSLSSLQTPPNSSLSDVSSSSVFDHSPGTAPHHPHTASYHSIITDHTARLLVPAQQPPSSSAKHSKRNTAPSKHRPAKEFCLDLGNEYDKSRFMIPDDYRLKPRSR